MTTVQYCTRCGHELTAEDFAEGFCLLCGEPIPVLSEEAPDTTEEKTAPAGSQEAAVPETVEWVKDGDFVVCPLCQASYYADEAPAACERCIQEEAHKDAVWVFPEEHQARLVLVHTASGEEIPLTDGLMLGRNTTDCLSENAYVSRRHAFITVSDAGTAVTDENSTNGTFVNGQRLVPQTAQLLQTGDTVDLDKERFEVR